MLLFVGKSTELPEELFVLLEPVPEAVVSAHERPTRIPYLEPGQKVIAVGDRTIYKVLYLCDGPDVLAEMQEFYDKVYRTGNVFSVQWCTLYAVSIDVDIFVITDDSSQEG